MSLLIKSLRKQPARRTEVVDVPATFLGFCLWLGVALTPGQAEFARVCYDAGEPSGGLGERLFGFTGHVPVGARGVVGAVCGARGGKSYVAVALRLVFGMLVRDLSSLAPGQRAVALIVSLNDKLRREVVNYAAGAVRSKPELLAMVDGDIASDGFALRRPDGHVVRFETGVATAGGYGARGRSLTDFALDECAFFHDSSSKVNDEEIYRAGSARVLPGGQTILASTPWAQSGLLYDLHKKNFGKPTTALVAHAPTLVLHDSPMTREIVAREEARDPDNAKREFGAVFMTSGTTVFFEAATLEASLTEEPFTLQPHDDVRAGGDFGFRSDSSALVLVAARDGVLHVFDGREERPSEDRPLKPSKTVASFAECIAGRCGYLMADAHFRESIIEHLETHGLGYMPAPTLPAESYVRARMLLREMRIQIHPMSFRDRMMQQLTEVHGKPTSGGGMSIVHPRWATGGHGDIASAFVLALWQLSGDLVPAPKPAEGSVEAEMLRKQARHERFRDEENRPRWEAKGGGAGYDQKHGRRTR